MSLTKFPPFGFKSTLFDRLFCEDQDVNKLSIQSVRTSVAEDLEDLLNTRAGANVLDVSTYPCVKHSILTYGIIDFVGLSTSNPLDRERICQSIEQAICAHEPRLSQVRVSMLMNSDNMGALCLSIQAFLKVDPIFEPIVFDAILKPMTQQYVISVQSS